MVYHTAVPFHRNIRTVRLADAAAPLPAKPPTPPAPTVSAPPPPPVPRADPDRERLREVLAGLAEVGENLYEQQATRLREMQQAAVELAVAVASHLTYQQLEAGTFPVDALVRHVVEQIGQAAAVTVYLNPLDLELLQRHGGKSLPEGVEIRLLADPALARGDCRAETGDLTLLAQLRENIREVREELLHTLPEAEVERRRERPGAPPLGRFPDRRRLA